MDADRFDLESQVRECYGRVIYAHKTHERMADRYDAAQKRVKSWQIALTAITAAFASSNLFMDYVAIPYLTALLSLITLIVTGYAKEFDPGTMAQKHRETASDIWNVRETYLSLLTDTRDPSSTLICLRSRRDTLQEQLFSIYRTAPHTDGKAYVEAQTRLQKMDDMTFTDDELDKFLPSSLKRNPKIASA